MESPAILFGPIKWKFAIYIFGACMVYAERAEKSLILQQHWIYFVKLRTVNGAKRNCRVAEMSDLFDVSKRIVRFFVLPSAGLCGQLYSNCWVLYALDICCAYISIQRITTALLCWSKHFACVGEPKGVVNNRHSWETNGFIRSGCANGALIANSEIGLINILGYS